MGVTKLHQRYVYSFNCDNMKSPKSNGPESVAPSTEGKGAKISASLTRGIAVSCDEGERDPNATSQPTPSKPAVVWMDKDYQNPLGSVISLQSTSKAQPVPEKEDGKTPKRVKTEYQIKRRRD